MTKLIDSNDLDFADTIKSLNPYAIDWSNVPDYLEKKEVMLSYAEELDWK